MTDIEILQMYGTVRFEDHVTNTKCVWHHGAFRRHAYGETQELAARGVVNTLRYILLHKVRAAEAGGW